MKHSRLLKFPRHKLHSSSHWRIENDHMPRLPPFSIDNSVLQIHVDSGTERTIGCCLQIDPLESHKQNSKVDHKAQEQFCVVHRGRPKQGISDLKIVSYTNYESFKNYHSHFCHYPVSLANQLKNQL